jgi:hypothetical protein
MSRQGKGERQVRRDERLKVIVEVNAAIDNVMRENIIVSARHLVAIIKRRIDALREVK